jgi:hypothetical protein
MKIERPLVAKLVCVALVAAIMLPLGRLIFPYVSAELSQIQFQALEAIVGATVGIGLSGILS